MVNYIMGINPLFCLSGLGSRYSFEFFDYSLDKGLNPFNVIFNEKQGH